MDALIPLFFKQEKLKFLPDLSFFTVACENA